MSEFLSDGELEKLAAAETHAFESPIPTQVISNGEFFPAPQSHEQEQVESIIKELGDALGSRHGLGRRRFLKTASGMAAAFLAMNRVYGEIFEVSAAEVETPELAQARAARYREQFICDVHTHFLRDDTRLIQFVKMREETGALDYNPALRGELQTLTHVKFGNYVKEIFFDSDTKIALLSGAPSEISGDWFLTNEMKRDARAKVNGFAGSKRLLTHAVIAPGQKNWLEDIDRAVELKPDAWKGYTIGDNTNKEVSRHPWRMDDEKLLYPAYEKFLKAGIKNVCVHKGLFPPSAEREFPNLTEYARVDDVGKAAKDWPQLNFLIYHAAFRYTGDKNPALAQEQFERTGRMDWVSDLAEVPRKYNVTNVYADIGAVFAAVCVGYPRAAAAMMGMLVKGLGTEHVLWGTDSVWFGSPQWQIEALRRLEIPEDMQQKHGFAPLGAADGETKSKIFGLNAARLFNLDAGRQAAWRSDRLSEEKLAYAKTGGERSNLTYGYVAKAIDG